MGLARGIEPGGLFPRVVDDPQTSLDDLEAAERWQRNHPSFDGLYDEASPPGVDLIRQYVDAGFGELYLDVPSVAAALGCRPHPAPLGTIAKRKPDGSMKYRLIQDQRRNGVNAAVKLAAARCLAALAEAHTVALMPPILRLLGPLLAGEQSDGAWRSLVLPPRERPSFTRAPCAVEICQRN